MCNKKMAPEKRSIAWQKEFNFIDSMASKAEADFEDSAEAYFYGQEHYEEEGLLSDSEILRLARFDDEYSYLKGLEEMLA